MLSPPQYLTEVEKAIASRVSSPRGGYHLCWFDEKIGCHVRSHTTETHHVFFDITELECQKGFTPQRWHRIFAQLQIFFMQEKACQTAQKQLPDKK